VVKNFQRARYLAQKSAWRGNADELRVSALSQFSSRRENATRQRYLAINFFARDIAGAANFATQNNFAPNAFMDALKGLARRKTRESVPSDSRRRHGNWTWVMDVRRCLKHVFTTWGHGGRSGEGYRWSTGLENGVRICPNGQFGCY